MVSEDDKGTRLQIFADPACRVGDKEDFGAQCAHDAHGKYDFLGRVSLVVMNPSFHADDRNALDIAHYIFSGVAGHCGDRKSRDPVVRDRADDLLHCFCKSAQAGTQDQRDIRHKIRYFAYIVQTVLYISSHAQCSFVFKARASNNSVGDTPLSYSLIFSTMLSLSL